eukprot:scaffold6484_cov78-Cylindrotheca_fusiformis.AAC.2
MMMNTIVVPPEKLSYTFQCHHASVRYILAGMYADAIHSIIQGLLAIEVTLIHDDDDNDYDYDYYHDHDEQMLEEDGTSTSSSSLSQQEEEEDPNKSPTSVDCKEMNHNNDSTIHLDRNPMDPSFLWCRNPPPELLLIALLYNLGLAYHLYAIILDREEEENNDDEEFKQQDPAASSNNTRAAALQDALKLYHATEKRLKSLESNDYSSYMRPTLRENMRHAVLSYYDDGSRRRCNNSNNNHLCNVTTTTTTL